MIRRSATFAAALLCAGLAGCIHAPKREGTVSLGKAFEDIKIGLKSFEPKDGEKPLGVWLTDIQVVLKVAETAKAGGGGELGVSATPTAKISFTSEATGTGENTITLTFKNPQTLGKDTIAGLRDANPKVISPVGPEGPTIYTKPITLGK